MCSYESIISKAFKNIGIDPLAWQSTVEKYLQLLSHQSMHRVVFQKKTK